MTHFLLAVLLTACGAAPTPPRPQPSAEASPSPPSRRDSDPDGDGILGANDRCPTVAEDCDHFQDEDGCPDPDDDRDGILDACDQCPREPETPNGRDDDDGCPDSPREVIIRDDIRILPHVQFAHGSARVEPTSYALLDEIARTMIANPQLERVLIRGNAAQGEPRAERLSEQRAAAVRDALVSRGVEAARLEIHGEGTARPLAPNMTEHGRAMNRRADFEITRFTQSSSPPTPVVVPRSPPGCPGMSSPPPPASPPPGGCGAPAS